MSFATLASLAIRNKTMSILLIFENKDPKPWQKILEQKLADTDIEIYPEVKDKSAVDFVVCWKPKRNVLAEFPTIKIIQSVGASIDHITTTQKLNENVVLTRIVDQQLSVDMWEFLLTAVMSQLKNMQQYTKQQHAKTWLQQPYKNISNTRIGILGLGKIGAHVAENFSSIGFQVAGWSNSKKQLSKVEGFAGDVEFSSFLHNLDFLINLLPLTKKTKDILDKHALAKTNKGTFLINVGRGEHLVEKDLLAMLDNSHLSGALLDVFREEPLPQEHPFWQHPKIQLTPHIASLTNIESAIDQVIENYHRFLKGEELLHTVSLTKGY